MKVFGGLLISLAIIYLVLFVGGAMIQYDLVYWISYIKGHHVDIPMLPCMIAALFIGWNIAIPVTIITWIFSLAM